MVQPEPIKQNLAENGFAIIEDVYSHNQISSIIETIGKADTSNPTYRKSSGLFAIRQFLKELPQVKPYIFVDRLITIINTLFGNNYFVVKSIYFDKPGASNWFVAYHQDLTISVDKKAVVQGFGPWSVKQNQYAVQPPLEVLESNFTIRIHLDDTDENNGALRVIAGSHLKGICRPDTTYLSRNQESLCSVPRGGIMLMRPLLLHASSRTTNDKQRRVIHIEFSNQTLPEPLSWSELYNL